MLSNINSKYTSLIVAVFFGISLSIFLGMVFYEKDTTTIKLNFRNDVDDKAAALEREIVLKLEILYSLKGLFDSSENVDSDEFKYLTESILVRQKNIQALFWAPKITDFERVDFTNYKRLEYPDFEITQEEEFGKIKSADTREIYFPIYYISPMSGNEIAIGYDLASNIQRLQSLNFSQDTGLPHATGNIKLLKDASRQGFLIFMPIYEGRPNTIEKRREQLRGFVLGAYRAGELFTSAIKRTAAKGINFKLYDTTYAVKELLYDTSLEESTINRQSHFVYYKELAEFAGRKWSIEATPTNAYISERRTILPYATVITGIVIVILLTIYTYIIIRNTEQIEFTVLKRTKDLNETKKKLEALSRTDSLTNIGNRRDFDETLEKEWNRATRDKTPLSILMIDIDNFKLFNDKYGHAAGDKCLKDIAHAMNKSLRRPSDKVTRYGGEEFVMILPNTQDAITFAEDCRQQIENLRILHEDSKTSKYVTISIGAATIIPELHSELIEFTSSADRALYEAKEQGRNKVVSAQQLKKETIKAPVST
jgi:diguanylate cyclase (GGDEF)-like protein